jgi:3-phosphoshikimate 1-carboxyvinyltransferase
MTSWNDGRRAEETTDTLTIRRSRLKGAFIDGHHDHRIVMAGTVAAMAAEGPSIVSDAEYVGVSFPGFYESMRDLGADIRRMKEE